MDRADAINQLRAACKTLALEVMRMHPTVPGLAHPPTQDAILRSLFELTSQIETIKKALARLETRDGSPLR